MCVLVDDYSGPHEDVMKLILYILFHFNKFILKIEIKSYSIIKKKISCFCIRWKLTHPTLIRPCPNCRTLLRRGVVRGGLFSLRLSHLFILEIVGAALFVPHCWAMATQGEASVKVPFIGPRSAALNFFWFGFRSCFRLGGYRGGEWELAVRIWGSTCEFSWSVSLCVFLGRFALVFCVSMYWLLNCLSLFHTLSIAALWNPKLECSVNKRHRTRTRTTSTSLSIS